jgi:hypothetical protein
VEMERCRRELICLKLAQLYPIRRHAKSGR